MARFLALFLCLSVAVPGGVLAAGKILLAVGTWSAIDRGAVCIAAGRSAKIASKGKVQALAGFTFAADNSRWGEFHAQLSRTPRAGSSVILTVGSQPFLLTARGGWNADRGT